MSLVPLPEPPDDDDPRDAIRRIAEELEEKMRPLGLYYEGLSVGTHNPELMQAIHEDPKAIGKAIEDGEEVVLMVNFAIGDVAWSTRVQNPEQHEFDKEAQVLLPDPAEELKEKLRKAAEQGKSIFDDPDDDAE